MIQSNHIVHTGIGLCFFVCLFFILKNGTATVSTCHFDSQQWSHVGESGLNTCKQTLYVKSLCDLGICKWPLQSPASTGVPGDPLSFCCKIDRAAIDPLTKRQQSIAVWQHRSKGFHVTQTSRTFFSLHQAFLGTALKYSSLEMSATPPYHFWSQIWSIFIFIKNHSYWRGHFLITGCLQK